MRYQFGPDTLEFSEVSVACEGAFTTQGRVEDPDTTKFIQDFTKDFKDEVYLDVGANMGTMSLVARGKVYAFEPCKSTFDMLKENCELNPERDVTPICEAVGDKVEKYIVHINENGYCGMNSVRANPSGDREIITIDNWAKENNIKNIKLIKIDTEGWDEAVVLGAMEIIKRDKPVIITEHLNPEILNEWYTQSFVCINTIWTPREQWLKK